MTDRIDALERLGKLRADGILSDEEFAVQKAALLDGPVEGVKASSSASFATQFEEGREKSKGVRRFIRWFFGIQMLAILLLGTYFLTRGAKIEETRRTQKAESAMPPSTAPTREADFVFNDKILATMDRNWETFADEPNPNGFCVGAKALLTNLSSKPMRVQAGRQSSDVSWTLGMVQPNATIEFDVGDDPGSYFIANLVDNRPLAPYDVYECDAAGQPR